MSKFAPKDGRRFITLPIGGTDYKIYSPRIEVGFAVQELIQIAAVTDNDDTDNDVEINPNDFTFLTKYLEDPERNILYKDILGEAFNQMIDAGLDHATIALASNTVIVWVTRDEDEAAEYWASDGRLGKTQGKTPQDRKPKKTKR